MKISKAAYKRRLVKVPRITTDLELRTIERHIEAKKEHLEAKREGRLTFKGLVTKTYNLIPKGAKSILGSMKSPFKEHIPPNLPSGGAKPKPLYKGDYSTELKAHRLSHKLTYGNS